MVKERVIVFTYAVEIHPGDIGPPRKSCKAIFHVTDCEVFYPAVPFLVQ